jgi:hypothetical protein
MEDVLAIDEGNQAEKSAEVERVIGLVMKAMEGDVRRMAEAMVLRRDDELLGRGEFELRDQMLQAACHILEAAIDDRKKGGTAAAARAAPAVAKTPASWDGEAGGL